MKKTFLAFLVATCGTWAGAASPQLQFGPGTGGGGFVMHCQANPVAPERVVLLDLYELPIGDGLAQPSGNLEQDYLEAVLRTYTRQGVPAAALDGRKESERNLTQFFDQTTFVENPGDLPKANDLGIAPSTPPNCRIEQVAFFEDQTEHIYILKALFDKMDSMNQAALVEHELMYRLMRELHDTDSLVARRMVGIIFSEDGPPAVKAGLSRDHSLNYSTLWPKDGSYNEISDFYITPMFGVTESLQLQFVVLQGRPQLSKTWANIPRVDFTLKRVDGKCVVANSGVNSSGSAPLYGYMMDGFSLGYTIKSGQPIVISLIRDDVVLSRGEVDGDAECQGRLDPNL